MQSSPGSMYCAYLKRCVTHTQCRSILQSTAKPSQAKPYRGKCAMYSNWNLENDFYDTGMISLA